MPRLATRRLNEKSIAGARGRAKGEGRAVDMAAGQGVPGLTLRALAGGGAVWTLRLRFDGRQLRLNLGIQGDGGLDAEAARAKARELIQAAKNGRDPALVLNPPPETPRETLESAFRLYAATPARMRVKSSKQEARRMELHVFPTLGTEPVEKALTAPVLVPFLDRLASSPVQKAANARGGRPKGERGTLTSEANRVYATLRAFAAWARQRKMIPEDPFQADGIKRPVDEEPSQVRQREETVRVLDMDELAALWRGLEAEPSATVRDLVRLLMLVPLRRDEVGELAWSEVEAAAREEDFAGALLRVPAARMKGKRPAFVPLSAAAVALLEGRLDEAGLSPFVFPGRVASKPFHGWRNAGSRVVAALHREKPDAAPFTVHDIRRSVASALVRELGADELLVGRILQHSPRAALGVTAVYQRSRRLREQVAVLEAWAGVLAAKVEGKGVEPNVVPLRRSA